jgi:hypothetical protein
VARWGSSAAPRLRRGAGTYNRKEIHEPCIIFLRNASATTGDATTTATSCPSCAATLVELDRSGIHIDACLRCRGIRLDRGELDRLIERERDWQEPELDADFAAEMQGRGAPRAAGRDDDDEDEGGGMLGRRKADSAAASSMTCSTSAAEGGRRPAANRLVRIRP